MGEVSFITVAELLVQLIKLDQDAVVLGGNTSSTAPREPVTGCYQVSPSDIESGWYGEELSIYPELRGRKIVVIYTG